jgi:hypothetical protein
VPRAYYRLIMARALGYAGWDALLDAPHTEVVLRYDVYEAEQEAKKRPGARR